jgi:hypothetical protein
MLCEKKRIYFVVVKKMWLGRGKVELITASHVTYYYPVPHTIATHNETYITATPNAFTCIIICHIRYKQNVNVLVQKQRVKAHKSAKKTHTSTVS